MIESLIQHLRQYEKLDNSTDVERFDATLSQIASANEPRVIGLLIPFFNDRCKFPEAMYSIIHTIERFDAQTYVRELLDALPAFLEKAPYWAKVLHFRVFNDPASRAAYRNYLKCAGQEVKLSAKELLTNMKRSEPKFVQVCDEMLLTI